MVNFDKILEMVDLICDNEIYDNKSFNEFCIEFFLETRSIPLSKFLRLKGYSNKLPKIMNTRKAGEVLYDTVNNEKDILNKFSYEKVPELNYSVIMILRKIPLEKNWKRIIEYLEGKGTIEEINRINQRTLLPEEKEKIEEFLKSKLELTTGELEWFLSKSKIIVNDKKVFNAIKKLV